MHLSSQICLITGSSRGLGAAIAQAFYREGAKVVLNHIHTSSSPEAEALAKEFGGALVVCADVANGDAVNQLFKTARAHYGAPITTVVNNALPEFSFNGEARSKIDEMKWSEFESQLTAVRGVVNVIQAALCQEESGEHKEDDHRLCVINIGSNLVYHPVVPYHDYVAAKAAILALTRTMAAELGPRGVRVNIVSGGLLHVTDASRGTPQDVWQGVAGATPLRKCVWPEEVADVCLFLASDWARAVTGQEIVVDGGLVMK